MLNVFQKQEECFSSRDGLIRHAEDADWRVRYAAATAIGEVKDVSLLPILVKIVRRELKRPLYTQPSCHFKNAPDDTGMAEMVGPIEAVFDKEYDEETLQAWQCRGRVLQAAYLAYAKIAVTNNELNEIMFELLGKETDDAPLSAGYIAFAACKDPSIYDRLKAVGPCKHYCANFEREKTLKILEGICG